MTTIVSSILPRYRKRAWFNFRLRLPLSSRMWI